MNVKNYIESGILSLYVLGIATEEEAEEIEQLAATHPEIKQALTELQEAMDHYAAQFEVAPPAHLKEKVLNQLATQTTTSSDDHDPSLSAQGDASLTPLGKRYNPFLVAASYILLALSFLLNIYLYNQWSDSERALALARSEQYDMARSLEVQNTQFTEMEEEIAILKNPNNTIITLQGVEELAPKATATIYWDKSKEEAYIYTASLPAPPAGKQYQLWAVEDDIVWDAGVFDLGLVQEVKCRRKPTQFIITLEKAGGVPKAEGAIYAVGDVQG